MATMEVNMVSTCKVPEDAFVSIRAGGVRRQAALASGKPFRFPKSAVESDHLMKFDVMMKIGSGYLVLKPNQQEGTKYKVVLGPDSEAAACEELMSCEVEVKPVGGDCPPEQAVDEDKRAGTAKEAKDYLDSRGLLQFVQGVLQVVVKEKPEDPYRFMAKHFLGGFDAPTASAPAPSSKTEERRWEQAPAAGPAAEAKEASAAALEAALRGVSDDVVVHAEDAAQQSPVGGGAAAQPPPAGRDAAAGVSQAAVVAQASKPATNVDKPQVLFVLGGPGAGKGTQCDKITSSKQHWGHISAGDCLRAERNNPQSEVGEMINSMIKEGKLVPSKITVDLLEKEMKQQQEQGKTHFLIDGFPRSLENSERWAEVIGDRADVLGVLFLDAQEPELERRLIERGKTSGRADDNIESIQKRFKTYHDETLSVVSSNKFQVFKVDGMATVEEVWKATSAVLAKVDPGSAS